MIKLYFILLITGAMYSQHSIRVQTGDLYGGPNFGRVYWHTAPVVIDRTVITQATSSYDYHTHNVQKTTIELSIDSIVQQTLRHINHESKISTTLPVSNASFKEVYTSMLWQSHSR